MTEESKARHERVVARAAELRELDPTLEEATSQRLAARELFPRTARPLPQHPERLRTTEEQAAIQADFTKRFGNKRG